MPCPHPMGDTVPFPIGDSTLTSYGTPSGCSRGGGWAQSGAGDSMGQQLWQQAWDEGHRVSALHTASTTPLLSQGSCRLRTQWVKAKSSATHRVLENEVSPRAAVGHSQSSHPCKHSRRTYMEHLQLPGDLWEVRKQNTHSPSECCQTSVKPNFVNLFLIVGSQNGDLPTFCPRLVAHSQQRLPRAHLWLWAPPGTGQPQQSCAQLLLHSGLLHPHDTNIRAVRGGCADCWCPFVPHNQTILLLNSSKAQNELQGRTQQTNPLTDCRGSDAPSCSCCPWLPWGSAGFRKLGEIFSWYNS